MKKIIIITLLLSPIALMAQNWVYHNVGDTIFNRDTIYYDDWWIDDWSDSNLVAVHEFADIPHYQASVVLKYCYTDQPLNIIGLAVVANCGQLLFENIDSMDLPEYLYLYDATPDSFPLMKQIQWHATDPKRYMVLTAWREATGYNLPCCAKLGPFNYIFPIREYYFRGKPITVTDSFYVGASYNSRHSRVDGHITFGSYHAEYAGYRTGGAIVQCETNRCIPIPLRQYKWMHDGTTGLNSVPAFTWYYSYLNSQLYVFPIIELDTSFAHQPPEPCLCPDVENIRVQYDGNGAVIIWDDNNEHYSWQVCYGPAGTTPDNGTIIDAPIRATLISGLDSCTDYVAYVRGLCHDADSICYGNWSNGIAIRLCDSLSDITVLDSDDNMASLYPNPTSNNVTITASSQILHIEAVNSAGKKQTVMDANASGLTIDISSWPRDTYLLSIQTAKGIVTKKLVVK